MIKILDGKSLSLRIQKKLAKEVSSFLSIPTLAIIQIGDNKESNSYIERKKIFGEAIGARVKHIKLPSIALQEDVVREIQSLNEDEHTSGIIVQMPIPKSLDRYAIVESINPIKDVDGLHSRNAGLVYERAFGGQDPKNVPEGLIPATAKGIISILKDYKISLSGKKVLVIGRSLLVGKPVAMLLLKEDATVSIAHSKTKNLKKMIKDYDVVVVAVGKAKFLGKECFRKGQVIIDVGTNAVAGKKKTLEEIPKIKLVGDVDFDRVSKVVAMISPVPGGVGPMTVASLFENLVKAYRWQKML